MKKIAALQMLVNTIDPIIIKHNIIKHNIWASYCVSREKHSSVVFFDEMSEQSLCVSLTKKVPFAFLIAVSYPGQVRLRAAGIVGRESYLLPAARFDSVVSRSHPRTPPAGWAGTDFLATAQNSITFPSFG